MAEKVKVAIIGSGNIGTDLMIKVLRHSEVLEMGALVGIDPDSDGLKRAQRFGVATTHEGIGGLQRLAVWPDVGIVFDATSAGAHRKHSTVVTGAGKTMIDLRPAAIGPYVIPVVNDGEHLDAPNVNMVTCGGQATIPIVAAISAIANVHYAEIVASISSKSAGPGTRANIDEFTETTARGIETVGGAVKGKAIIILNPAELPMLMRDTVFVLSSGCVEAEIESAVEKMVERVSAYVPGYRLKQKVQFERFGSNNPQQIPSLLGLLCGILINRGDLDPNERVQDILPELAETAYSGATIRDLLDMRAGVFFDENYLASAGPIIAYRKAMNWNPLEPGDRPSDLRTFFQQMRRSMGPHGGPFNYVSPNTDLLGWVIEEVTKRRYVDLMSELIWKPARAWRSAYITVDSLGAPRCAGGFCATLRDLGLIGLIVAQGGQIDNLQILPRDWLLDTMSSGDPKAWAAASFCQAFPDREMHYRSQWYVQRRQDPMLFALGIHGQWIFVDHHRKVVMAKMSSQDEPLDFGKISLTMKIFDTLRHVLK